MNDNAYKDMAANNTSGHTGVSFYKFLGKYCAYVCVDCKQIHIGVFENIEDAAREAKEYYGQTNE